MWLGQWVKEIDRKRKDRAGQRESFEHKRPKRSQAGSAELRHIRLTAADKQKLRAKIIDQTHKTVHSSRIKIVIYLYMAIMILGVVGAAIIVFIYQDVVYPARAIKEMLSCLIAIAFCVVWLKLSSIRKIRALLAAIPGIIMFVFGSGLICFGATPLREGNVATALLLGVSLLVASYFLCFNGTGNTDSQRSL